MKEKIAPLSLAPELVRKLRVRVPASVEIEQDDMLDIAERAMEFAQGKCGDGLAAYKAIIADPMKTRLANLREASKAVERFRETATKRLDTARASIVKEIERLEQETAGPKRGDVSEAREIRAALRAMDAKARDKLLKDAVEFDNATVLSAVLAATPFLSGLAEHEQAKVRHEWRLRHYQREVDRVRRLTIAVDTIERGGNALNHTLLSLVPDDEIKVAEQLEAAAKDAAAKAEAAA